MRFDSASSSTTRILEIQGSRCITIGSTNSFVTRSARDCSSLTAYSTSFQYLRYQSTSSSQPSILASSTVDPLPPVGSKGKEKAKVELRPGPAKLATPPNPTAQQKSTTTTTKPSSQTPEAISKPHPTKPPPVSVTPKTDDALKEESIIEIAKKDVEIAAQHGILAPPPPDAGFARRLFHQAKELFVCPLIDVRNWMKLIFSTEILLGWHEINSCQSERSTEDSGASQIWWCTDDLAGA